MRDSLMKKDADWEVVLWNIVKVGRIFEKKEGILTSYWS